MRCRCFLFPHTKSMSLGRPPVYSSSIRIQAMRLSQDPTILGSMYFVTPTELPIAWSTFIVQNSSGSLGSFIHMIRLRGASSTGLKPTYHGISCKKLRPRTQVRLVILWTSLASMRCTLNQPLIRTETIGVYQSKDFQCFLIHEAVSNSQFSGNNHRPITSLFCKLATLLHRSSKSKLTSLISIVCLKQALRFLLRPPRFWDRPPNRACSPETVPWRACLMMFSSISSLWDRTEDLWDWRLCSEAPIIRAICFSMLLLTHARKVAGARIVR